MWLRSLPDSCHTHKRLKKYTHVPRNDDGYEDARGKVTTGSLGLSLFDEVDGGLLASPLITLPTFAL